MAILVMQRLYYLRCVIPQARNWLLVAGLMSVVTSVSATEGDTVRPFVTANMGYDSNLFRFASDAEAQAFAGESKIPSISYQSYGAGVDVDWKQGRQQVKARVSGNKTFYSKYSDLLDYAGREINGDWKWQLGNRWSGNLSASQNRTQSAYNDTTNGVIASNVRTDNRRTFQLDYWLHTDWRARAKLSNSISNYSAISQKVRDNSTTNATVGLYRLGQSVESVGVEVSKAEGTYDTHSVSDYSEQGVRLIGTWNFSGKTGFSGHMGYVQRERPSSVVRNFSGPEWNLRVTWTPTGKSQVEAALFRDLRSNDVVGSGHEVADGIKATVALLVAPKTRLITQASHDDIGYKGDSRSDKLTNLSISASYEAWRGGDISAGWQHSSRSSTDTTAEFDSNSLFVSANLRF